jgi:hypothetical protein
MTSTTITRNAAARRLEVPRLTYVAAALIGVNLIGGALAVMIHVNTFADAFGNKAEMASPWPMFILMIGGGLAVARWRGWRGVLGTIAIALPCVLALLSTSDSETFKPGMPTFAYVYQVIVIATFALALVPCGLHLRDLRKRRAVAA